MQERWTMLGRGEVDAWMVMGCFVPRSRASRVFPQRRAAQQELLALHHRRPPPATPSPRISPGRILFPSASIPRQQALPLQLASLRPRTADRRLADRPR